MKRKKMAAMVLAFCLAVSLVVPVLAQENLLQSQNGAEAFNDGAEVRASVTENPEEITTAEIPASDAAAEASQEVTGEQAETVSELSSEQQNGESASETTAIEETEGPAPETADVQEAGEAAEETGLIQEAAEPVSETTAEQDGEEIFTDLDTDPVFADSSEAAASVGSVTISCAGKKTGVIRITGKAAKKVESKDNYYYLFQVDPATGSLTRQIAKKKKPSGNNKRVNFDLKTSGHPEYIQAKYVIAVKTGSGSGVDAFTAVSRASYVKNPEKTALYQTAYELPSTKKGLQTTEFSELTSTNSKAVFFNLAVSTVLADNAESVDYTYNGKTYSFNKIGGYTTLVSRCNAKGIPVTVQLLLDWTPSTKNLTASKSQSSAPYYAWDTVNSESRQKMEALFSFLAQLFGSDDCYVSNWVLGNEVNSSSLMNDAGNVSQDEYVGMYSEAFRCLYNAVRGVRASSKCFICLDFYWNTTVQGYAGKTILNAFHAKLGSLQAHVNWNLAYHAYPFPLTDARFWKNSYPTQTTSDSTSPVITLNNLSVLTNYIKTNFGSDTRIILSEQGFTSSQGEDVQAAAIALAYYIAACNPMIDTFHIRSYQDQAHEVVQGLSMGIKGKKSFKVFKYMDSKKTLKYTASYLKSQVGTSWTSMVPNYKKQRLYKLYRS